MARCPLPWLNMIVNVDGEVTPCCYWRSYGNSGAGIGNVNRGGFLAVWNAPDYVETRRKIAAGERGTPCDDCVAMKTGGTVETALQFYGATIDHPRADTLRALMAEYESGEAVLSNPPTALTVVSTASCNIDCTFCNQTPQRVQRMRLEDQVVDEISALAENLTSLAWQGGEALLDRRFKKFVEGFDRSRNPLLRLSVVTNGLLATPDFIAMARQRFAHLAISFSVDSFDKHTYERLRRGSSYDRVMANLRHAVETSRRTGDVSVAVQGCLMKSTIKEVRANIEAAWREGIGYYSLSPVLAWPPTEALNYFTDFHRQTEGWHAALQDARDALADHETSANALGLNALQVLAETETMLDTLQARYVDPLHLRVEVVAVSRDILGTDWPVERWSAGGDGLYAASVPMPFMTLNTVNFEYVLFDGDAEFLPGAQRPEGLYRVLPGVRDGQYRVDVVLMAPPGRAPAPPDRPISVRTRPLAGNRRRKKHGDTILALYEGMTLDSPLVAYLPVTGPGSFTVQIPRDKAQGNLGCMIIDDEAAYYASKCFQAGIERGADGAPLIRIAFCPELPAPVDGAA